MIDVYTCGYTAGEGSPRYDWRKELMKLCTDVPINWLHPAAPPGEIPGQGTKELYGPRDALMIERCDVLFAYIDLDVARCLGASWEMGVAWAYQKQVILVDKSPSIGSLDLNRWASSSLWYELRTGAQALRFIAKGFIE